jgi:pimeloyl-ACP methyl ester carboxylesterase
MKTHYKILVVVGLVELLHYWRLSRRYTILNNARQPDVEPEQTQIMMRYILSKNPDLFERAQLHENTSHIRNEEELYDCLRIHDEERPDNRLQVGCSKLYWRYHPFAFEIAMKVIRQIGNGYMRYLGFSRSWHKTADGYYSVWSHIVPETKAVIVFPGFGLGAIPYAKLAQRFDRTLHMIEVPNMGYATPYSLRHATTKTIYEVVSKYGFSNDVFAHSMGSAHAAMWVNENTRNNGTKLSTHNVVICDGFVNPVDSLRSHMYPFVDYCDYPQMKKKPRTRTEFNLFLWVASHNLEFNSFAKRNHNLYDGTLWDEYPKVNIKYVYSANDILYDTDYLKKKCECLCIEKGGHGSVLFGKQRDTVLQIIKQWLSA